MDFPLNQNEKELRDSIRALSSGDVRFLFEASRRQEDTSPGIRTALAERGLLDLERDPFAETGKRPAIEGVISIVETARASPSLAAAVAEHNFLFRRHVRLFGNAGLKAKYLDQTGSESRLGAWGILPSGTPPGICATRRGEAWVINGRQRVVSGVPLADWLIVTASSMDSDGREGSSTFVLDRSLSGFKWEMVPGNGEDAGLFSAEAVLSGVLVPGTSLVGAAGRGGDEGLRVIAGSDVPFSGLCLGLGESALGSCLASRRFPGSARPSRKAKADILIRLAERAIDLEEARFLTFRAALGNDSGQGSIRERGEAASKAARAALEAAALALELLPRDLTQAADTADLSLGVSAIRIWSKIRATLDKPRT